MKQRGWGGGGGGGGGAAPKRHPEECEVFPVEPGLRAPGTAPVTQWVEFHSLEDVFPGSGLAAKFDEDGVFRAALHQVRRRPNYVNKS